MQNQEIVSSLSQEIHEESLMSNQEIPTGESGNAALGIRKWLGLEQEMGCATFHEIETYNNQEIELCDIQELRKSDTPKKQEIVTPRSGN